ncbi:MAG TPA: dTDP-4-dehydrorhamnose 3,5-epimerase, partial [Candidatus Bathyarchaeia archaeon]|nr:dTDP-4-dehydrorhamnose 3,5-epimerase [Candidatus Bathyarchaeia archaeon]
HFKKLSIPDVILITPDVYKDQRGFFFESYRSSDFEKNSIGCRFVQTNHSRSERNVLRGLHYQLRSSAQAKMVHVNSGELFDVAVDIRKGSPYYGQWVGETLSGANKKMLYIPPGFAHGFCVLSETAEIMYYCSSEYAPACERGIIYNDPDIAIDWPVKNPILSDKDSKLPLLKNAENDFEY